MANFIELTVFFAKDQTRKEYINMDMVYRYTDKAGGKRTLLSFNSTGSDSIVVEEPAAVIDNLLRQRQFK